MVISQHRSLWLHLCWEDTNGGAIYLVSYNIFPCIPSYNEKGRVSRQKKGIRKLRIWSHPVLFCKNHRGIKWFLLSLSVVPLCGGLCWVHTLSRFLRQLESNYSKLMLISLCIMNTDCPLKNTYLAHWQPVSLPLVPRVFYRQLDWMQGYKL